MVLRPEGYEISENESVFGTVRYESSGLLPSTIDALRARKCNYLLESFSGFFGIRTPKRTFLRRTIDLQLYVEHFHEVTFFFHGSSLYG